MTNSNENGEDPYNILYTMGVILLVPHIIVMTLFFLTVLFYQFYPPIGDYTIGVDEGVYAVGTTILSGLIAMVYANIKRRRRTTWLPLRYADEGFHEGR